jgi:hypothetical protein
LAEFDELAEAEKFARQQEGARIIDTVASFRPKPSRRSREQKRDKVENRV